MVSLIQRLTFTLADRIYQHVSFSPPLSQTPQYTPWQFRGQPINVKQQAVTETKGKSGLNPIKKGEHLFIFE